VTSSAAHSLGLTAATAAPQQNVGLGGVPSTQSKGGSGAAAQKELPPKEQLLPNEFAHLVEQFKNVVQEEKNRSSDVARCSVKEFRKVETELDSLNHQFNQVENQLLNNRNLAEQLKYDTAKGLQHVEMAQRTQDTPPSLQYDNTAPLQFFLDLADNFEREMQILKLKIDNTEKFVKKCNEPNLLTSQGTPESRFDSCSDPSTVPCRSRPGPEEAPRDLRRSGRTHAVRPQPGGGPEGGFPQLAQASHQGQHQPVREDGQERGSDESGDEARDEGRAPRSGLGAHPVQQRRPREQQLDAGRPSDAAAPVSGRHDDGSDRYWQKLT
jgi:hypothetical protein